MIFTFCYATRQKTLYPCLHDNRFILDFRDQIHDPGSYCMLIIYFLIKFFIRVFIRCTTPVYNTDLCSSLSMSINEWSERKSLNGIRDFFLHELVEAFMDRQIFWSIYGYIRVVGIITPTFRHCYRCHYKRVCSRFGIRKSIGFLFCFKYHNTIVEIRVSLSLYEIAFLKRT